MKRSVRLDELWYGRSFLSVLLAPLGALYGAVMGLRRALYRARILRSTRMAVPVIVVGNISVGGTGKTPLVIWLAETLKRAGKHPGVVSRGYGGAATSWPQQVRADSDPRLVGDEPVLIARRAACPVVVDPDRVRAAQTLLATHHCDVLISDDGLQHYALARDVEIAVVDGTRRHGNGRCLPAGPLREPLRRLRTVDVIMVNGGDAADECSFHLIGDIACAVDGMPSARPLAEFAGQSVHAVAGIGRPARFFEHLRRQGVQVIAHPYPDHYLYRAEELRYADHLPVLMTEKDAVKCRPFADPLHWYVPVSAHIEPMCKSRLQKVLSRRLGGIDLD